MDWWTTRLGDANVARSPSAHSEWPLQFSVKKQQKYHPRHVTAEDVKERDFLLAELQKMRAAELRVKRYYDAFCRINA